MMYTWLLCVLLIILSDKVCMAMIKARLKQKGYIYKKVHSRFNLESIIAGIVALIPYVNLVLLVATWVTAIRTLVNDEYLLKWSQDSRHSAKDVKGVYESRPIKKEVLQDAMVLDGADEKTISEEMAKVDTLLQGIVPNDDTISQIYNLPEYTEKEYNWACAQYNAENLLEELKLYVSLDAKQRVQLLQLFKDGYFEELKDEESKEDTVEKILSIIK